ncbi:MAG: hypothetical protein ABT940_13435 [Alphaproteobacteria bacterium]
MTRKDESARTMLTGVDIALRQDDKGGLLLDPQHLAPQNKSMDCGEEVIGLGG